MLYSMKIYLLPKKKFCFNCNINLKVTRVYSDTREIRLFFTELPFIIRIIIEIICFSKLSFVSSIHSYQKKFWFGFWVWIWVSYPNPYPKPPKLEIKTKLIPTKSKKIGYHTQNPIKSGKNWNYYNIDKGEGEFSQYFLFS